VSASLYPFDDISILVIAIIDLKSLLATEEVSKQCAVALSAILNATCGNAVELIVGVIALKNGQIDVVQGTIIHMTLL